MDGARRPMGVRAVRPVVWVVGGMTVAQATNQMVAVAVPSMLADLSLSVERAGWIISAYLLPVSVLMPTWGAAGDLFGRHRVFRIGLVIFAAGALVAAMASSFAMVLLAQAILAIGASSLNPNGTALVTEMSPPSERGRTLGRLRMVLSAAGIAAAPIGGILVQVAGWHAIFLVGPVLALALAGIMQRDDAGQPARSATSGRFDIAGAVLLTVALLALLAALTLGPTMGWTAPPVLACAAVALVGLGLLGPVEARQTRPLVPVALFRRPAYRAVILICFMQAFACFGTALLGPLLLQRAFALEPWQSGWLLASFPIGMAAGGIPGGWLADRRGNRITIVVSLIGVAGGLCVLMMTALLASPLLFLPGALMTGFSASLGLTAMSLHVLQVAGEEQRGVAMGFYTMVSIFGDVVGVALLPTLLAGASGPDLVAAFARVYLVAAGVALLGILPALSLRAVPSPQAEPAVALGSGQSS